MTLDNSNSLSCLDQEVRQRLNRLASLELLLPAITHEINNALNFIRLEAEPFKLDSLDNKIDRISELAYALQAYARQDKRTTLFQLNDCLNDVLKLTSPLTKHKMVLEKNILESLPLIKGNFYQLKQVVTHLILQLTNSLNEAPGTSNLKILTQEVKKQVYLIFHVKGQTKLETPIEIELSRKMLAEHQGTIQIENISNSETRILIAFPSGS